MSKPPFSRPGINALAGGCLLLFLVGGLASNVYGLIFGKQPLTKDPITTPAFLNGHVSKEIADRLADTFMPATAAQGEREASWLAIGDLGPRVRQGCPDWLFLTDELTSYKEGPDNAAARAQTVVRVAAKLKSQGIDLLVAVVPDKSRIEHEHMCGLVRPPEFADRATTWLASLDKAGVQTVNLEPALSQLAAPPFLRTDTHWNEVGASAAATAIAERIRSLHSADGLLDPPQAYRYVPGVPAPRPGDLVRLAGIDKLPMRWQPPEDVVPASTFEPIAAAPGPAASSASAEDDLFGDDGLPRIAVIGTSFSRNSNFVPFLGYKLSAKVANFARDGGEFAGAAHAYFGSPAFKQTPPKLIVWEIPERSLQRPLAGEESLD
jgi:alginate O-acetyltransferase complex protein AlgJ